MKCTTCGAELVEGAVFCTNCGTRTPFAPSSEGRSTVQLNDSPVRPPLDVDIAAPIAPHMSQAIPQLPQNSTLAVVSLVAGILGIVQIPPVIGPVTAIVTGHMARREIRASSGNLVGDGMALAGLIMGYLMLVLYALACIGFLLFVTIFASQVSS